LANLPFPDDFDKDREAYPNGDGHLYLAGSKDFKDGYRDAIDEDNIQIKDNSGFWLKLLGIVITLARSKAHIRTDLVSSPLAALPHEDRSIGQDPLECEQSRKTRNRHDEPEDLKEHFRIPRARYRTNAILTPEEWPINRPEGSRANYESVKEQAFLRCPSVSSPRRGRGRAISSPNGR